MAVSKISNKKKKQSYIAVPSQIIHSISSSSVESLLHSPKKKNTSSSSSRLKRLMINNPRFWLFLLVVFSFIGMLRMLPFSPIPCSILQRNALNSNGHASLEQKNGVIREGKKNGALSEKMDEKDKGNEGFWKQPDGYASLEPKNGVISPTKGEKISKNGALSQKMGEEDEKNEEFFWKQPDGMGYKPCLEFSEEYGRVTEEVVVKDRSKYLMVVVSGGMNQQRNQIVDAVVIARILGAALVVPILQVNVIWGDESEFSEIFDLGHFKEVLENDVRIVSSLPSTHLMTRPVEEKRMPLNVSPQYIRSHYLKRIRREGVLLLRGLDSRLSKDLPSDLQKLRCKVAFHALRFAPSILELGNKLTERMRSRGPYLALHLRMEKDVWVRTGCLPGLSHKFDGMIKNERKLRPELLTSRSNMTYHDRKLAGLCPLNALEVTRLLKALGAPKSARIFWAGGIPLGGKNALQPLIGEFPHFYNKEDLALPGELEPFAKKASFMAAIDYIVSENSDVFMPSHGGNMGRALQGHRAYAGHKKTITPNKRQMLSYFLNSSLSEAEFSRIIMDLHQDSLGRPELRTSKAGRDVTKYPVPECMCNSSMKHALK